VAIDFGLGPSHLQFRGGKGNIYLDVIYYIVVHTQTIQSPALNGGISLNQNEFGFLRKKLGKTQKQMAELLGISIKAIQSFEQGWRKVPLHIERQVFFLMAAKVQNSGNSRPCWKIRGCSPKDRNLCPAWEFQVGNLCWFINGTICQGKSRGKWSQKMAFCKKCEVFISFADKW
jgi:DNA-binding XRE family transcriptional regulator